MLRVVSTSNDEVFRHLASRALQGVGVDHAVGNDYATVLELVRTKVPNVAIIDVNVDGGSGYDLCKEITEDAALSEVRVILALDSLVTRGDLDAINDCGCDDVLGTPIDPEDFYHHVIQVAGVPYRRFERVELGDEMDVSVEIATRAGPIAGTVENMSLGGVGVIADAELVKTELVEITLSRDGEAFQPGRATVAWSRPAPDGKFRSGLSFAEMPLLARLFIESLCLFEIELDATGSHAKVRLHGDFGQSTDFTQLAQRLADIESIEFNMREVRTITSIGTREWCDFLDGLRGKKYDFRHASIAFASQVSQIAMAAGSGDILSFEAPYRCDKCDREDVRLFDTSAVLREHDEVVPPRLHCGTCKTELIFDDVPWRYFAFLVRQRDWVGDAGTR